MIMKDLKELGKLFKENPILIVTTLLSMVIGAILGIVAFYKDGLDKFKLQSRSVLKYEQKA